MKFVIYKLLFFFCMFVVQYMRLSCSIDLGSKCAYKEIYNNIPIREKISTSQSSQQLVDMQA